MIPAPSADAIVPAPLLAAGWVDSLGPLLVVGFWILRQVYVAVQEQRELERAKREALERGEAWPPREAEPAAAEGPAPEDLREVDEAPGPAKPAPARQDDLRSEIEEFLRRAGMPPANAPAGGPAAGPVVVVAPRPVRPPLDPFEEPPRKPRRPKQRTPENRPATTGQSRPAKPLAPPRETEVALPPVGSRPLRSLPESQLAEKAAHLGETIAQSDDRLESRLHDKFDHRLGTLDADKKKAGGQQGAAQSPAARIRSLLLRPGGAREAVILSEIFRRPVD